MKEQFLELEKETAARGEFVKKDHIRQGKVGGWRDFFTAEQEQQYAEKLAEHLARAPGLETEVDACLSS